MKEKKGSQNTAVNESGLVSKGSSLANLLDSAYIVIDLDGVVVEVNVAAQHLLGLTEDALVGRDFFAQWVVPNMGSSMVDQVLSEKLVRGFVADMKRGDGMTFIGSINAQMVVEKDYNKVIECLVSDVTEGQKQQEEFAETLRSVTGGIAHLINNQMASVVGTADLVKMELGDRPELAEKLAKISESGIQASDVAHNLANYADTADMVTMDEVDVTHIISTVEEYYQTEVKAEKPRKLTIKLGKKIKPIFSNDEAILKMMKHLFDNAVDATEDNGVIIISSKNVTLVHNKTGMNKKYVLLSVEDHGHGMDKATQQRIFEPFYSTRFAGRGMSLAQVLKTIKKFNGQIRIKTGVGKGSVFKIYFPAAD